VEFLRGFALKELEVMMNDQLEWENIDSYDKIILSPGPGTPKEAGSLMDLIEKYQRSKSILGICLGHQAIAEVYGASLINTSTPSHGQKVSINLSSEDPLFTGLPKTINGGLYHSWVVDGATLPPQLKVTARIGDRVMGIRHTSFDISGVQFHPESYATEYGVDILRNWIEHR